MENYRFHKNHPFFGPHITARKSHNTPAVNSALVTSDVTPQT